MTLVPRVAGLFLSFLLPELARAQNLVVNANFDTDLSSWTDTDGDSAFSRVSTDAGDAASSGSALVETVSATEEEPAYSACIDGIVSNASYDFGARIGYLASPGTGSCWVRVEWYLLSGCNLTATEENSPAVSSATHLANVWHPAYSVVVPFNRASARIYLVMQQTGAGFFCQIDGVILAPAGSVPLPLFVNGFESFWTWAAVTP